MGLPKLSIRLWNMLEARAEGWLAIAALVLIVAAVVLLKGIVSASG